MAPQNMGAYPSPQAAAGNAVTATRHSADDEE
jgi:hypothetical protein